MGKNLRNLGLVVLAAAAWVILAGEFGWISSGNADRLFEPLLYGGATLLAAGLLALLLAPLFTGLRRGRCVRCGASTERGQAYCLDHLRATVHEARDHVHDREMNQRRHR